MMAEPTHEDLAAMVEQMIKPVITGVSYHFRAVAMTNLGSQIVVAGNLRVVTI